jgi:hypothetical protein
VSVDLTAVAISEDGTHHIHGGRPLYEKRFVSVLKFHAPGLAPVIGEEGAYHIDLVGRGAYPQRYRRTFGFYEDRAAVIDVGGWLHVLPDGSPLSRERFAWCGNFQEGRCTVREVNGGYVHLEPGGQPAYGSRWCYAGDYREGCAVVMAEDGRSTHVDSSGRPVHGQWFLDLDVFHKGFARARDRDGWHHVDRLGRAAYSRRFALVEPFYNGFARAEDHDGARLVIDELGSTVIDLRNAVRSRSP